MPARGSSSCLDLTWVDADHAEAIIELFRELKAAARRGGCRPKCRFAASTGPRRWVEVHLTNLIDNSAVGGYVCNMRDIGARRNVHMQLVHDAQHDPLTHLANRRLFLERLDHAWTERTDATDVIAVLFIDVDHFKEINDRLGHEVGDHVLLTIANALSTLLRPTDLVARFGGDEFTVLLDPFQDLDSCARSRGADPARRSPGRRASTATSWTLAVSVGVATSRDANSASELLRHSDEAMYCAKRNGRARVESVAARAATPATATATSMAGTRMSQ